MTKIKDLTIEQIFQQIEKYKKLLSLDNNDSKSKKVLEALLIEQKTRESSSLINQDSVKKMRAVNTNDKPDKSKKVMSMEELYVGTMWKRGCASIIDGIITLGIMLLIYKLLHLPAIMALIVSYFYEPVFIRLNKGATVGKSIMGLKVVLADRPTQSLTWITSFVRSFLKYISMLIFILLPLGFALTSSIRLTCYDMLAKTRVVIFRKNRGQGFTRLSKHKLLAGIIFLLALVSFAWNIITLDTTFHKIYFALTKTTLPQIESQLGKELDILHLQTEMLKVKITPNAPEKKIDAMGEIIQRSKVPAAQLYLIREASSEAKLLLSAIFYAEKSWYNDNNKYVTCIDQLGIDVSDKLKHYAVGFPAKNTVIDQTTTPQCGSSILTFISAPQMDERFNKLFEHIKTTIPDLKIGISEDGKHFKAIAVGEFELDGKKMIDAWTIDENNKLEHIIDLNVESI